MPEFSTPWPRSIARGARPRLARPALRRSAACTLACALALSAAAPAHADGALWFFPNESDAVLRIVDGAIDGVPVQRTGWLVLGLDPAGAAAARAALAQDPAVDALVELRGAGDVLRLRPADGDELALSRALRGRPGVRWAHPDLALRLRPHALPDDPLAADQWHLENTGQRGWTEDADIDAERAWAQTTGAGLV
ncbi:MAG: Calcium-dependent protease precursor, partial [Pseudomonadota bacterium]